jgi:Domain of unknown function (DUF4280)
MAMQVTMGAQMMCSFGLSPSVLIVLPVNRTLSGGKPAANIMDHKPVVNIPTFGMCRSLANPSVAAATARAKKLTPMPCVPVTPAPWVPGAPTALIANFPALDNTSKCLCSYGGVISLVMPGQFTEQIP